MNSPTVVATTSSRAATTFSDQDIERLILVCDTLIPSLDVAPDPHGLYARAAGDLNIAPLIAQEIAAVASPDMIQQLKLFLSSIENPVVNGVFGGASRPFSRMDLQDRTAVLRSWEESRLNLRRKAFQSVKRLAMMFFYGVTDASGRNPNWDAIGYSGPPGTRPDTPATTIVPLRVETDTVLTTDVVIVGSGAGGGVVAGELTAAGYDVIVLEKGGFHVETDFDGNELASTGRLFENRGLLTTADLSMLLLAGSTLGGGTTVNWSASFRTPDDVLREWEQNYGVTGFTGEPYQQALDTVTERLNVNTECAASPQNSVLEHGARQLGLAHDVIPRNTRDCEDCGFCNFGCQFGAKQSTLRTYLQDAFDRGGRVVVDTNVQRVLTENGQAVGVEGVVRGTDGQQHYLSVRAQAVVVAAGALHTPAVLMRSGLGNANIGSNLHLHPTTLTYGIFDEPIRGWQGAPMSRYVSEFKNLDGRGYGVTLETAPVHPGIGALALSWANGKQHKDIMLQMGHLSNIIIITRDTESGRITLDRSGYPQIHYTLGAHDARHMMRGLLESMRIQHAAGAKQIGAPFALPFTWYEGQDFDEILHTVGQQRLSPNNFALFSAHQMSSCRLGGSAAQGVLKPTGETYEVRGLYVADGSVLPTATGVNPMLTIMAVAHVIAGHIKADMD
jgi:choline dehydrogenase-like flavoprotein